jgi:hypothetical protein
MSPGLRLSRAEAGPGKRPGRGSVRVPAGRPVLPERVRRPRPRRRLPRPFLDRRRAAIWPGRDGEEAGCDGRALRLRTVPRAGRRQRQSGRRMGLRAGTAAGRPERLSPSPSARPPAGPLAMSDPTVGDGRLAARCSCLSAASPPSASPLSRPADGVRAALPRLCRSVGGWRQQAAASERAVGGVSQLSRVAGSCAAGGGKGRSHAQVC